MHCYASSDECGSKPQRQTVRLRCGSILGNLKLLQEQPETSDDKAESHQGQTRTYPCEKSSLGCQVIAKVDCLPHFFWAIHFCCLPPLNLLISPLARLLSAFWRCLKHHLALDPDAVGAELLTVKRIAVEIRIGYLQFGVMAVKVQVYPDGVLI